MRILPVGFVLTLVMASAARKGRLALFRRTKPHKVWAGVASDKLGLGALSKTLLPILGGAVVAILLGRWERRPWKAMVVVGPVRRAGLALSAIVEGCDNVLRQWPTACISLLTLAALFGASMLLFS